jgi:PAS domain S-box-containing protein
MQLLDAIVENMPHMVFVKDADTLRFVLFNKAGEELLGLSREQLIGKSDLDFFPAEQAAFFVRKDREVLSSGKPTDIPEEELLSPSLGLRFLHTKKVPISDRQGRPRYLLGISEDITELKAAKEQAEEARRITADREAYYRSLMENASDLVTILEADGTVREVSPSVMRILGYQPHDRIGRKSLELIHPEDLPEVGARLAEALADPARVVQMEFRIRHRDGSWRRVESTGANLLAQPAVRGIVINTRDVTKAHNLEEQLVHAQKMEAVARLAGGVAHDFNNLLTVIDASAEFLLGDLSPQDPRRADAEEIKKAAQRAASLTRQLLAFSRRQVLQTRILDVNTVIGDLDKMLRRLIGEDIELVTALADDTQTVLADPGQLEQVVMNLVVNARDAMPKGGRLTIETGNVALDAAHAATHADARPGRYTMIAVTDSGTGMTREVQQRIFEPFFTTKSHGTGLGLATVYGIVKQSQGHLEVYSEVGTGTTFKVYLPASDYPIQAVAAPTPLNADDGDGRTVLLVEDDSAVRVAAQRALEAHGYRVLTAAGGDDAGKRLRDESGPLHLLVTDVVMPGVSGRALAEELQSARPGLKVLFVSGYTDEAIVRHGVLANRVNFLQKPFTGATLARKVREVLES